MTITNYYEGISSSGYTGLSVPSWEAVIERIHEDSTHLWSELHGESHWQAVAAAGGILCAATPRADRNAVMLFSLLHDSMRLDDDDDPHHGHRAAMYVGKLAEEGELFHGSEKDIERLILACAFHNKGSVERRDATVGCCWDADRVNLWRVGIKPSTEFMSTEKGFDEDFIYQARFLHKNPPSWEDVIEPGFLWEAPEGYRYG